MSKLVTIYGGSGFVGRYVARRLAQEGWRVRVAVRRPNEALFVKPYGAVGQVEPVFCNIRDDALVRAAMAGADAVVNCVGTFDKGGRNNFDAVQAEGAGRIARIAAESGVSRVVHVSAIGAAADAPSLYARSKAAGEAAVAEAFPAAVILRPSIVFGPEDNFFNRFASMTRMGPILPITGGATRFQPVYVDDLAQAAVRAVTDPSVSGVYEIGGPDVMSFRDLMGLMLSVINRRRLVWNMPRFLARIIAGGFDLLQFLTGGLFHNSILTGDQVRSLGTDTVVSADAKGLKDLGIAATGMSSILPDYLWRFRPSGQYDAIKASAKNLRRT